VFALDHEGREMGEVDRGFGGDLGGVEHHANGGSSVDGVLDTTSVARARVTATATATGVSTMTTTNTNVIALPAVTAPVDQLATHKPPPRSRIRGRRVARGSGQLRLMLIALDAFALLCAWAAVSFSSARSVGTAYAVATVFSAVCVGLVVIASLGLYRSKVSSVRAREFSRLVWVALAVAAVPITLAAVMDHAVSGFDVVVGATLTFLFLIVTRSGFDAWLRDRRANGEFCRKVAIVGTNEEAAELFRLFADHPELGYRVVGFIGPQPRRPLPDGGLYLGSDERIVAKLRASDAGGVIIAAGTLAGTEMRRLIRSLVDNGFHVHCSGGLWGIGHRRVVALPIGHEPLFYIEPPTLAGYQLALKRALDVVVSSLILLITMPLLLVCALIIKLYDGGPVLFRQQRIGRDGRPFDFYKLRSMVPNADQMRETVDGLNLRDGPLFKADNDPRITPFGRVLRMSSLDELPQLLNVLKGDMSLVGPRPALGSEFEKFDDELQTRQQVRPGISGLWQVEARDNPSFAAYRRLDLFYVENWSVSLDLVILVLTAQQVTARIVRAVWGVARPKEAGWAGP
jgi:exopolysaccharide biosynthesis polyprenyl glycosylphosphotransferase